MKSASLVIFCGISLVLHFLAAGVLYWSSTSQDALPMDVLDLTMMAGPSGGSKSSKGPQLINPKKSASASSAATSVPAENLPVAMGSTSDSSESGNGVGGDGESGPLGEWGSLAQKPKVLKEIKAQYTAEARARAIEGLVVCDLILDEQGKVRSVILVQGLGAGLDEAAQEALRKFEFLPAKIGDKKVAVKIRYKYRFQLQHQ